MKTIPYLLAALIVLCTLSRYDEADLRKDVSSVKADEVCDLLGVERVTFDITYVDDIEEPAEAADVGINFVMFAIDDTISVDTSTLLHVARQRKDPRHFVRSCVSHEIVHVVQYHMLGNIDALTARLGKEAHTKYGLDANDFERVAVLLIEAQAYVVEHQVYGVEPDISLGQELLDVLHPAMYAIEKNGHDWLFQSLQDIDSMIAAMEQIDWPK
jgi:hypothetical protein